MIAPTQLVRVLDVVVVDSLPAVVETRSATRSGFLLSNFLDSSDLSSQCSKIGHIARNCPEAGGYGGQGGGYGGNQGYGGGGGGGFGGGRQGGQTCYSCGGYGHMSRKSRL